ncbi:MAG: arginine--tRNA ligase [Lachnospiraceae bacterium]|nr:arginine--tRNA ligase [Lachnospiraceae bacterium]
MKKLLDMISDEVSQAFAAAGYDGALGRVTVSNRPDLCEYQCNGAMAGAKRYHCAPIQIAENVAEQLKGSSVFSEAGAVKPGFLNLKLSPAFAAEYMNQMVASDKFGVETPEKPHTIILDYGGANAAKPLHVGHLRSAIIGESVKRICRFAGHTVIGDVHLGDWGLQMGLIITELRERRPDLVYFDENFTGDYPEEPPFTISELEEIYPTASKKSRDDGRHEEETEEEYQARVQAAAEYKSRALEATADLQKGRRGYRALWRHIMKVSVADLKKNYDSLNVSFDLWKGESDVQDIIPDLARKLKEEGYAYESDGALVVDIAREDDTKEMPPCMILKSDGAALYTTTDIATIVERVEFYHPDEIIYFADKRQELHFEQVFRCVKKTGLAPDEMKLQFIGFGTMNGKDGRPFKTRDGGVLRLETLINDVNEEMYRKIAAGREVSDEKAREIAQTVSLAAIKYGDLSNQAGKDYIFDIDRFTSFEGDTGPYILYTIVRIKSILRKYQEKGGLLTELSVLHAENEAEKALMLETAKFNAAMESACEEKAPHRICTYIYDLCNAFNHFYHETRILAEENEEKQKGYIALLLLVKGVLEASVDVLGFEAPEEM